MKQVTLLIVPIIALASLSACARYESKATPVSTEPAGSASSMPQSPNSLPLGSAVDAPLTRATGNVGTTRVGPSSPARRAPQR